MKLFLATLLLVSQAHAITTKTKLALNWKAYDLEEDYDSFLNVLKPLESEIDMYVAPPATDLVILSEKLKIKH